MTQDNQGQGGGQQSAVNLQPNLEDPDGFYEELLGAHEGLTSDESFELNARLLMLLANQVGKREVLSGCIRLAREAARANAV
jgi:hypothetical protein